MTNMENRRKALFAAWALVLLLQVTADFCPEEQTVQVEIEETVFEYLEYQNCDLRTEADTITAQETVEGKVYCTFKRSKTVTKMVPRTKMVDLCCKGYMGKSCDIPVCDVPCLPGKCIAPNRCDCNDTGYTGEKCEIPICSPDCVNGDCSAPSTCACNAGWSGRLCNTPVCEKGCKNGGTCSSPNTCTCTNEFKGDACEIENPQCPAKCLNGGKCVSGNICKCTEGYIGDACERAICEPGCQNGGKCQAPQTCVCVVGYEGKFCELKSNGSSTINGDTEEMRFLDADTLDFTKEEAACVSWNMNHYVTFDGLSYYFPGKCIYNLAYACSGIFHIQVDNAYECDELGSCSRAVILEVDEDQVLMLLPDGTVTHNDKLVNVPKTIKTATQSFLVEKLGDYSVVGFANGVRVFFDNNKSVYIRMPKSYKSEMCGLCGNFDGDLVNDFTLKDGTEIKDPNSFGNRMTVHHPGLEKSACSPVPVDLPHPCAKYDITQTSLAEKQCEFLMSEAFSACHDKVDPTEFVRRCVMDVCEAGIEQYEARACDSFTHYSRLCSYNGIILSWRLSLIHI